jgi:hypothetical protein
MRNEEFDVVRDLIAGRAAEAPRRNLGGHALAPATFREIDGEILARQYVAHRKFLETEAMAASFGSAEDKAEVIRNPRLRADRVPAELHVGESRPPQTGGWLASLARLLWRR